MRFSIFVLLPAAAVMAAPDFSQDTRDLAKAKGPNHPNSPNNNPIDDITARQEAIMTSAAKAAAAARAATPIVHASGNGSAAGLGAAYGDLTTLLSGLSDTLAGLCNLQTDLGSLTSSLGSLGL